MTSFELKTSHKFLSQVLVTKLSTAQKSSMSHDKMIAQAQHELNLAQQDKIAALEWQVEYGSDPYSDRKFEKSFELISKISKAQHALILAQRNKIVGLERQVSRLESELEAVDYAHSMELQERDDEQSHLNCLLRAFGHQQELDRYHLALLAKGKHHHIQLCQVIDQKNHTD